MAGFGASQAHANDLSDEALCDRWIENPCFHSSVGKVSSSISYASTARR
jgi:hypothetical protein